MITILNLLIKFNLYLLRNQQLETDAKNQPFAYLICSNLELFGLPTKTRHLF